MANHFWTGHDWTPSPESSAINAGWRRCRRCSLKQYRHPGRWAEAEPAGLLRSETALADALIKMEEAK